MAASEKIDQLRQRRSRGLFELAAEMLRERPAAAPRFDDERLARRGSDPDGDARFRRHVDYFSLAPLAAMEDALMIRNASFVRDDARRERFLYGAIVGAAAPARKRCAPPNRAPASDKAAPCGQFIQGVAPPTKSAPQPRCITCDASSSADAVVDCSFRSLATFRNRLPIHTLTLRV
jgi:hypothetical protein